MIFEAECIKGLEGLAAVELKKSGAKFPHDVGENTAGTLRFRFGKSLTRLDGLRIVSQVFKVHFFDIPRPKAFLGQQHFDRTRQILNEAIDQLGRRAVKSFRLEAAGRDSAVFQRLISQIESDLGLPHAPEAGDLFLRVKPARLQNKKGWELLVRQTIRPLATRSWRRFNYPGALAAPVASVMVEMAKIQPEETIINLMCGSGTLLAECKTANNLMVGCDLNAEAVRGARVNLEPGSKGANLFEADATFVPVPDNSFDVLLIDLPWGQLIGEIHEIQTLYPKVLDEAWRISRPGGRFAVVTQLKKLMRQSIKNSPWDLIDNVSLDMGRVKPEIYLLKHNG